MTHTVGVAVRSSIVVNRLVRTSLLFLIPVRVDISPVEKQTNEKQQQKQIEGGRKERQTVRKRWL